jgi:hypothetical protein
MARQCESSYRIFLPFLVPIMINIPLSGWIAAKASFAHEASKCELGLPWGHTTAMEMIEKYYHSAWTEVNTLERISSRCIASLHADMTSAFLCIAAAALLCGVLSMPFAHLRCDPAVPQEKSILLRGTGVFIAAALLFAVIGLGHANFVEVIDFNNERKRIFVEFINGYIDVNLYWIIAQGLFFIMSAALWLLHAGAICLRRALVKSV